MPYWSFFHRAQEALNNAQWQKAEKWLTKAHKQEKHPLAQEYLLYVWLMQNKWQPIKSFFQNQDTPLESIGLYVKYWYLWYQETWLSLEPCLYQMIACDNIFVRLFALFRLHRYHKKPIDEFLNQKNFLEGIATTREEEKRASRYRQTLNDPLFTFTPDAKYKEDFLDVLLLREGSEIWDFFKHLPQKILAPLTHDPRILWELARLAFEHKDYAQCEKWLKKLESLGFSGSLIWYHLGHVSAAQKKWFQAGLWYEKAIEKGLDTPTVWKNLAILSLEQGYLKEASTYLKESLRLKRDPEIIYALAIVNLKRRKYIQAYELLRRCLAYEEVREMAQSQIDALKRFLREKAS
ncbi:tetratricopeptide repeat protein [Thermospira aquatica]|uniref:Tetratricopeptide repeat protein n=1 Tax=Thermospira aquatica TaxID=2828656 RepID=A0AAX3BAY2_9SPIR|nr:hypothetical protein [Thermospira aquatica]URA09448.1 hypothetical protein KDW03_08095 [Thermospira aquatica]